MIDAFGVERTDISKGLRINLPVKLVQRIADPVPRDPGRIKAVADQISSPIHGFNQPVQISFSRQHQIHSRTRTTPGLWSRPGKGRKLAVKYKFRPRLINGHHRLEAHKLLGRKKIYAEITRKPYLKDATNSTMVVPKGEGFGPNKNQIFREPRSYKAIKPPTFSRENIARIVSNKKKTDISKGAPSYLRHAVTTFPNGRIKPNRFKDKFNYDPMVHSDNVYLWNRGLALQDGRTGSAGREGIKRRTKYRDKSREAYELSKPAPKTRPLRNI